MVEKNKEVRLIFNAKLCRDLLKRDCTIVDIKPNREDKNRTVFAFKNDANFQKAMEELTSNVDENKNEEV